MSPPGSGADDLGTLPISFDIVGVQKGATTTLASVLFQHPEIAPPAKKALHFFDDEERDWQQPEYGEYRAVRTDGRQRISGEATPTYLWWPQAMRRLHDHDPATRLICVFRDPLERIFSQWQKSTERSRGKGPDWPRFIRRFRPAQLPNRLPSRVPVGRFRALSGVSRGYYGAQLERGLGLFDRDQWLLLEFGDLLVNFESSLDRITDFLDLERFTRHPPLEQRMQAPELVTGTPPTGEDMAGLAELYAADHARFVELSGLDVSQWPLTRILQGSLDPAEFAAQCAARVVPQPDTQP